MTLEQRKDNTYFDQTGKQIIAGDLLKVYRGRRGRKKHYDYQVVVMEQSTFPVLALKDYNAEKPHARLYIFADNEQRVFADALIIDVRDVETIRKKIKVLVGIL